MTNIHVGAAHIPGAVQRRIDALPATEQNGLKILRDFGIFIDTHRDQPHVGSFNEDIHRGHCVPTMVDYIVGDDLLRHPGTGKMLPRHDKHLFITAESWNKFLLDWLMTKGEDPRSGDGSLPTSHFRDPRAKVYLLRSFRQMVIDYKPPVSA